MVLVGVHPSLTQHPPMWLRSISAVLRPLCASAVASGVPDWPDPITTQSNFFEFVAMLVHVRSPVCILAAREKCLKVVLVPLGDSMRMIPSTAKVAIKDVKRPWATWLTRLRVRRAVLTELHECAIASGGVSVPA
jgi:hypothetical protein